MPKIGILKMSLFQHGYTIIISETIMLKSSKRLVYANKMKNEEQLCEKFPRRKSSFKSHIFKPPGMMHFQVAADTVPWLTPF